MQFDWWTFALQVVNFLILVWLLQHFLYKPVRRILAERRAAVDERIADAEKAKDAAEKDRQNLEAARAAFDAEKEQRLADLHRELSAERESALEDARKQARAIIEQGRHKIEAERADALKSLNTEIAALAADMAARIVTGANADPATVVIQFHDYAAGLTEDELRTLRLGLDSEAAQINVATPADLNASAKEAWTKELGVRFGDEVTIGFVVDGAVLGGAELRFPHAVVRLSAAGALTTLKDAAASP